MTCMEVICINQIVLDNNIKLYVKGDQAYTCDLFRIVSYHALCAI